MSSTFFPFGSHPSSFLDRTFPLFVGTVVKRRWCFQDLRFSGSLSDTSPYPFRSKRLRDLLLWVRHKTNPLRFFPQWGWRGVVRPSSYLTVSLPVPFLYSSVSFEGVGRVNESGPETGVESCSTNYIHRQRTFFLGEGLGLLHKGGDRVSLFDFYFSFGSSPKPTVGRIGDRPSCRG